jgi:hypothetical protein
MTGMEETIVTTTRGEADSIYSSTVNKRTTATTNSTKTAQKEAPTTISAKNVKVVVETAVKRINDGTGSNTKTKTENKTISSDKGEKESSITTKIKTTTKTIGEKLDGESATETQITQQT